MIQAYDAGRLWQSTLAQLKERMTRSTFEGWLKPTAGLDVQDGILVVGVPNAPTRDWLAHRLDETIRATLAELAGCPVACRYVVQVPDPIDMSFEQGVLPTSGRMNGNLPKPTLNPRYTFDTFVAGSGNRLAHAAAQAVAEHPAKRYNPLFIHGGVGLGKTHLLHAIGHAACARGVTVLAVSSEKFTNDLINAIRTQSTEEFRSVYRAADMLLIDDIQFIAGKESTQEEFFHTFNAIHGADGQIVVTSDRPPQAIATLEDRLRSRFQWGLLTDIEPPDLETRIAILLAKSERQGYHVSQGVIELIAQSVQQNVRELEGALNRVIAYAEASGLALNLEVANRALADLMLRREPPALSDIIVTVAAYFGLEADDVKGRSRAARVSEPRQIAMYLMREETDASYPAIGNALGGRDHTTILHGCDKIGRLVDRDAQLRRDILQIRERLYAR